MGILVIPNTSAEAEVFALSPEPSALFQIYREAAEKVFPGRRFTLRFSAPQNVTQCIFRRRLQREVCQHFSCQPPTQLEAGRENRTHGALVRSIGKQLSSQARLQAEAAQREEERQIFVSSTSSPASGLLTDF